jgi:SAM-dependent methyltransferase
MTNIFNYTYNILFINNWEENLWFRHLLTISFIIIVYYVHKKYVDETHLLYEIEGFSQSKSYIFKKDDECFDEFYIEMYDTIYNNYNTIPLEMEHIIKNTEIDFNSKILILDSKTGLMVNEFDNYKYDCYGIEKSKNMFDYCNKMYPNLKIDQGNILKPLAVTSNSFSHVISNNFNLYNYKDKYSIFKNVYYWLNPNGYFIVHLIDPNNFDTIMPVAKPCIYKNVQKFVNKRIKRCDVNFLGFKYNSEYIFKNNNKLLLKEKFTDKQTNHVRDQERTLYLESINNIISIAKKAGFHVHGQVSMKDINGDNNQFIYFFEKIH